MMGAREPLMYRLVPALTRQMGQAYPELNQAEALITETLKLEENRFRAMLDRGISLLRDESEGIPAGGALSGAVAFKLYDTFGFPLDLTQDALREEGKTVDVEGFTAAMAEQKARARAAWSGSGEAATEAVWFELNESLGATEFLGYSTETAEAAITALVVDGQPADAALPEQAVLVLLNQTPFYAESGGQVGDTGYITGPDNLRIRINDTQKKLGSLFVHVGVVEAGTARVGQPVAAEVEHERRGKIRAHHSAAHLLHEALRRRLGTHITQKGSLNAPDRLRFDISQPRPITAEELAEVERDVNAQIRENSEVTTRLMTPEEAVNLGAMALFGEKYGDEVRVVAMGAPDDSKSAWTIELCGGTHVQRTGDIGLFRIVAEGAVSAGIRRIEALAGAAAVEAVEGESRLLAEAAATLKAQPAELPGRITQLQEDKKRLERQVSDLQKKLVLATATQFEDVASTRLLARNVGDISPKELRPIATELLKTLGSGIVALISTADQKAAIVVAVSDDQPQSAVELVRVAATALGGQGGGGNKAVAQAGGPNAGQAAAALAAIRTALNAGA
jgi:alanyl-tRNA synthetase